MALSDSNIGKKDKRNARRSMEAAHYRWSDSQKLEAIQSWLALGNLALTARLLSIPEITLRQWKNTEWWSKAVEEIKLQEKIQLSARLRKLVEASQVVVAQRLESGDAVVTKGGDIIYKPVSLRDAHRVSVDLIDRQHTIDKMLLQQSDTPEQDDNKLEKLAERFAEMATKSIEKQINKRRTVDVEEVPFAIHDERETGLQEGAGVGEDIQARTGEASDDAERSEEDGLGSRSGV